MDYIKDFAQKLSAYKCILIINEPKINYLNDLQDKSFLIKKGNKELFSIECDIQYHFDTSLNDWVFKSKNEIKRFKNLGLAFSYSISKLENSLAFRIDEKQTLLQKIKQFLGVKQ